MTTIEPALDRGGAGARVATGSEMASLVRAMDWSKTPLGRMADWPASLRTVVDLCLTSRYAMTVFWGPELVQIYNDAYRPILGAKKHPTALGRPAHLTWPEIWSTMLGPMFGDVLRTGTSCSGDDTLFLLDRYGYVEETYFNFSYDPIRDEGGRVGGVFVACHETTSRVLGERRLGTLRDLAEVATRARSEAEACALIGNALARNPGDVPFAALYRFEAGGARLASSARIGADALEAWSAPDEGGPACPWGRALQSVRWTHAMASCALPAGTAFSTLGDRPPPTEALVLPLTAPENGELAGALVVGRNPRRALDAPYREFLEVLAQNVASTLTSARAHQAARDRAEALAELDRAKTVFFGEASHELRTPLTLLLGPADEALAEADSLPARDVERWRLVRRNGMRLARLVNTLLDFSQIEAGRVRATYEPTDLAALTSDLASVFRSAVERAGLRYELRLDRADDPAFVDREMWEKIVLNLLSNALKFTFEGEIAVELHARPRAFELVVKDTGIGVPPDEVPRIFERFHRVRGARARTHEGTGIGLALVQELVKLHGGTIAVESAVGRGTSFVVSIPKGSAHLPRERVQSGEPARGAGAAAVPFVEEALRWVAPPPAADGGDGWSPPNVAPGVEQGARILVVDDNADMRAYLARLLQPYFRVEVVDGGDAAIRAARAAPPDLVLTDVMMPAQGGFDVLRTLKADPATANVPVVLLSARAGEEATAEGLQAGANDYVVKPFSARELVVRVRSQLAIARARREADDARVAAERAARVAAEDARARLHSLFMQTPTPVCIVRGERFVLELANRSCLAVWGKDTSVIGMPLLEALPELEGQGFDTLLREVMRTGRPRVGTEVPARLACGADGAMEETYFDFVYAPLREDDGTIDGVLVCASVVTEQVRARRTVEQALRETAQLAERLQEAEHQRARLLASEQQARAEAERSNRAKDEFLAVVSHELRNPLSAMLGWTRMLRTSALPAATRERALETIERNAVNQSQLIEDLLDISRIVSGKLRLDPQAVDLARVVEAALESARPAMDAKRIQVETDVAPEGCTLVGDPTRLQQVAWNLLTNATKFTPSGGHVRVTLRCVRRQAELTVADDGQGIAEAFLPHVFERFRQADSSTTRSHGGLGLGLAISKNLVEMHGGTIDVRSDGEGRGATFVVRLPLDAWPAESSSTPRATLPPSLESAELVGARVLVVDDEPDARELVAMVLGQCGASVVVAPSARDALRAIETAPPDVLVTDIGMPEQDGYALIERVRALPRERGGKLPAASLTAYASAEDRRRALQAGFDMHVAKPVEPAELVNVVATLVRMARAMRG